MDMKGWKFKLGIVLIIISVMLFLTLFSMPFIAIGTKYKITISTALLIAGETTFWVGTIFLGKEVWNKYKSFIKSAYWPNKKKGDPGSKEM
jgi:hypothetical protein